MNSLGEIERSLPKIKALSKELVHRIAAGEVVERPSSALKELIENSIDAGATRIKVNVVDGGFTLLEIEDDGWGMSFEDLKAVAERHATSKISRLDDLDHILTLGFRGEALSAISSVARLEIDSHRRGTNESYKMEVIGGHKGIPFKSARTKGTKIKVAELFFNIPARRKFLKKSSLEMSECADVLEVLALSHPEVAFEWYLIQDGELKSQKLFPVSTLETRFLSLLKLQVPLMSLEALNPIQGIHSLKVLALKAPHFSKFSRSVRLLVNGRSVSDKRLPFAVREAFLGLIEPGFFPNALVSVNIDPSMIDVNIHPQKKEIRWPVDLSVGGLAYRLIHSELSRETLKTQIQEPTKKQESLQNFSSFLPQEQIFSNVSPQTVARVKHSQENTSTLKLPQSINDDSFFEEILSLHKTPESPVNFQFSSLKVIGECGATWILCESPDGLIVIDQHAAHERVQFEKFLHSDSLIRSKPLLFPLNITLPLGIEKNDLGLVPLLEATGFEIDDSFQDSSLISFIAVPELDRNVSWKDFFESLFERVKNQESLEAILHSLKVKVASSLACHGSVRRGQRLAPEQIKALLLEMDQVQWGGLCPHGRPVWQLLSHNSLEEIFHRS